MYIHLKIIWYTSLNRHIVCKIESYIIPQLLLVADTKDIYLNVITRW